VGVVFPGVRFFSELAFRSPNRTNLLARLEQSFRDFLSGIPGRSHRCYHFRDQILLRNFESLARTSVINAAKATTQSAVTFARSNLPHFKAPYSVTFVKVFLVSWLLN
jgi:hypothetical protein